VFSCKAEATSTPRSPDSSKSATPRSAADAPAQVNVLNFMRGPQGLFAMAISLKNIINNMSVVFEIQIVFLASNILTDPLACRMPSGMGPTTIIRCGVCQLFKLTPF